MQQPSSIVNAFFIIILIASISVGFVWQKVQIVKLVTDIDKLEKERQKLEERIGTLNSKVLELSDGDRLVKIGLNELHMAYPKTELIEQENIYKDSDFEQ